MYGSAKEKIFVLKAPVIKSTRDRTLIILHKSPGLYVFASDV